MPKGASARYSSTEAFEFPPGAILAKTFSYPGRIIETRLLVNTRNGWVGVPYVWNKEQTEATLEIAPDPVRIRTEKLDFTYIIPNTNQCKACHDRSKTVVPIGPKARHLNKMFQYATGSENQLEHWARIGYLTGAPCRAIGAQKRRLERCGLRHPRTEGASLSRRELLALS